MPAHELVNILNDLFTRFDFAAHDLGIKKSKLSVMADMAVCGLPDPSDRC